MIRRPPRSTQSRSSSASDVYKRQTLALPFGPDCAFPSQAKTERIRACDAVVGVSQYVADYIRQYAGIDAVHVPISLLEPEALEPAEMAPEAVSYTHLTLPTIYSV